MEYRCLGNTGLKVSVISFGNWLNSNEPKFQEESFLCMKKAWELGINFFDTAEAYGEGEAERQLGEAILRLSLPREDLVISTKIFSGTFQPFYTANKTPNTAYLSRKHIIEGLKASLKRLHMTYVDICFAHRPDPATPMEEICRAFDWCVRNGLCHYWGTSEWSACDILEAYGICDRLNLHKPVSEQAQYNLFITSRFCDEYGNLFKKYKMGSTVWGPLLQGLLTGKYNNGVDQEGRLGQIDKFQNNNAIKRLVKNYFGNEEQKKATIEKLQLIESISKEIGCTQSQFAMAWVIKNKNVSSAITGASKPEQLIDIVGSIEVYKKITPEIEKRIEELFNRIK